MTKTKTALTVVALSTAGWAAWHYAPGHPKAEARHHLRVTRQRLTGAVGDRVYPWRPARPAQAAPARPVDVTQRLLADDVTQES